MTMSKITNLRDYLSHCRLKIQEPLEDPFTVVLGNESADLDSVVASITYAYAKQLENQESNDDCREFFPVLNIISDDFKLRTDVVVLLEHYGIVESMLIFTDEINLDTYKEKGLLSLCLVDHNLLKHEQTHLKSCVVELIDHHVDENAYPHLNKTKTIENVGSCCTLITEKLMKQDKVLIESNPVADLLLAAITVDTANYSTDAGRVTTRDHSAAVVLRMHAVSNSDELYKISEKAKHDVSNLSVRDMLRKDTKSFKTNNDDVISISSVTCNPIDFVNRVSNVKELAELCCELTPTYELFVIMFIYHVSDVDDGNSTHRDFLLHSNNQTLTQTLDGWLLSLNISHCRFNRSYHHPLTYSPHLLWYKCEDSRCSRKIFMPLLKEFFEKRWTGDDSVASLYHTCFSQSNLEQTSTESTFCDSYVTAADETLILHDTTLISSTPNKSDILPHKDTEIEHTLSSGKNLVLCMDSATSENDVRLSNRERASIGESSTPGYDDNDSLHSNRLFSVDEQWDECGMDIGRGLDPTVEVTPAASEEPRHKIFLKELSFDDVELKGSDLLAPVFLAIAEDDGENDAEDDILKNMRPKAQSIENLCFSVSPDVDQLPKFIQRRRTKSELPPSRHRYFSSSPRMQSDDAIGMVPLQRHGITLSATDTLSEIPLDNKTNPSDDTPMAKRQDSGINSSEEVLAEDERSQEQSVSTASTLGKSVNSFFSPTPGLWNRYLVVSVANEMKTIDLFLIEPYVKVVSHGGYSYQENEKSVVMVFSAAYLPCKSIPNYDIVMEQLFYYVVHVLTLSVVEDYVIVYFNSGATHGNMPRRNWLKQCYLAMERRLRKNLQRLYIVHSNFWLKALIRFHIPFISSKFTRKIQFVKTLTDLGTYVPTDYIYIPDIVARTDAAIQ